jgi:hypothetical protein
MDWQNRLLEELIYERVRLHVDLIDLIDFERDLGQSISRALREAGTDPGGEADLARRYVERAWNRLEEEWIRERGGQWTDCPLCEAPLACPDDHRTPAQPASPPRG